MEINAKEKIHALLAEAFVTQTKDGTDRLEASCYELYGFFSFPETAAQSGPFVSTRKCKGLRQENVFVDISGELNFS